MLALVAPGVLYFLVFHYLPWLGNVIAFERYLPYLGFTASPWVGFDNFRAMAADEAFWQAVRNTLVIALMQLVLYFPAPIALALLINSLAGTRLRRLVQSVVYLPHLISWVIIVAVFQQILGGSGPSAHAMAAIGLAPVNFMASPPLFKWMVVAQLIWKDAGWAAIIYLAALLNIDPALYEAAAVDGANRLRQLWHVTLPGILGITVVLFILRLGNILNVGFLQILIQRDAVGPAAGEILDTYVYFHGIVGGQLAVAAASGLIKAVVGAALVIGANRVAHLFGQEGIYHR